VPKGSCPQRWPAPCVLRALMGSIRLPPTSFPPSLLPCLPASLEHSLRLAFPVSLLMRLSAVRSERRRRRRRRRSSENTRCTGLQPYTLHPTPYTLHPTPYTLHPTPYTQQPTPYRRHPTPYPTPCTFGLGIVAAHAASAARHEPPLLPPVCL